MGTIVFSVDAELGWGFHDEATPPADRIERSRWGWRQLHGLFVEFDVPATWAVVGHLLLEGCDARHGDHPAGPDWFVRERTTWGSRPDLRFGRGLVARLRTAPVDHEIGCHTFSHVEFDTDSTRERVARAELKRSLELAADAGISLDSFVFPRNEVGHRDLLAEFGFSSYRGRGDRLLPSGPVETLARATAGPPGPRLVTPTVDEYGLVNVPPSLFLFSYEGLARRLTSPVVGDPVVAAARRGIDAAADGPGVFHCWLHPNNLTGPADVRRLRRILTYVDTRRADISIATMGTIAAETCQDRPRAVAR